MLTKVAPTVRQRATSLLRTIQNHSGNCPCHACTSSAIAGLGAVAARKLASAPPLKEYAFELAASNIRYGNGVTREVGMDFKNIGAKKVAVFTDSNVCCIALLC